MVADSAWGVCHFSSLVYPVEVNQVVPMFCNYWNWAQRTKWQHVGSKNEALLDLMESVIIWRLVKSTKHIFVLIISETQGSWLKMWGLPGHSWQAVSDRTTTTYATGLARQTGKERHLVGGVTSARIGGAVEVAGPGRQVTIILVSHLKYAVYTYIMLRAVVVCSEWASPEWFQTGSCRVMYLQFDQVILGYAIVTIIKV